MASPAKRPAVSNAADLLPGFRSRFPEFSSTADSVVTEILGEALIIHKGSPKATQFLAAHILTLDNDSGICSSGATVDGGEGEVTSESVGAESASYKTQAENAGDVFFTTTAYGRRFLALRRATPAYGFSVRVFG